MNHPQSNGEDEGKVDRLRRRLYDQNNDPTGHKHGELHQRDYDVDEGWEHEQGMTSPQTGPAIPEKKKSWINRILIFATIFFVAALGFVAWALTTNYSEVSPEKIDIAISGPVEIDAGEELSLVVQITNDNQVSLEGVQMMLRFPEGTRSADDSSEPLPRYQESLGDISAGGTVESEITAMLFGSEGASKEVEVVLEYGVPDSTAIFTVNETYVVEIGGSPLTLSVSAPQQINSGQEVELTLLAVSNSQTTLQDVVISAKYPFGFELLESDPPAQLNGTTFPVGDIEPGSVREISIRGHIFGQNQDQRTFRFLAGVSDGELDGEVETPFDTLTQVVEIRRPYLELELDVESGYPDADQPVVVAGGGVSGSVRWQSNLSSQITDAELTATIGGQAVNYSSMSTDGLYRSSTGQILWNSRNADSLGLIDPGDNGSYGFSFDTHDLTDLAGSVTNPRITVVAEATGRALSEDAEQNVISSSATEEILVATVAGISETTLFHSSPLDTDGPIPPEVDEETTYTVRWQIKNATSDLSDTQVTATLPAYVEWGGQTASGNGESENISYNPVNGMVVWQPDTVEVGVGYRDKSSREVFFTVTITPTDAHVGDAPVLVRGTQLRATDAFTGISIEERVDQQATTELNADPEASDNDEADGRVQD